jgi:hypothetical protein
VALTCYSRGLAEYLRRTVATWPRRHQPAYVGEFLSLGRRWGAASGSDDDSDYWERRLPEEMLRLAADLPVGQRFDAVVVDESQDFAAAWWPALLAALRDEETGGVYAFTDEGQVVFAPLRPPARTAGPYRPGPQHAQHAADRRGLQPADSDADASRRRRRPRRALRRVPAG